jgi:hypothetical protein
LDLLDQALVVLGQPLAGDLDAVGAGIERRLAHDLLVLLAEESQMSWLTAKISGSAT